MTGFGRKLWRVVAAVFAAAVILAAVAVGLFRLALTQVPERRGQIEAWAAEAIGLPVELGGLDARLGWRGPELGFTDARILAADGTGPLIEAREGGITIGLLPLLSGRIVPTRVLLSGVALDMTRTETGAWQLLGPSGPMLGPGGKGFPLVRDLQMAELRLADLTVRFEDRKLGLGPWSFDVSRIDLFAEGDGATLRAAVGLPAVLGRGVSLDARMRGQDAGGLPLGWTVDVDAQGLDLAMGRGLFAGDSRFPAAGTVDAQVELAGSRLRPERLVGRIDAEDMAAPGPDPSEPYDRLSLRFDWSGGETGWQLRLSDLAVRRGGSRWGSPTARLEVSGEGDGRVVYADADFLRLEDLVPAAVLLPGEAGRLLGELSPSGGVRGLVIRTGPGPAEGGRAAVSVRAGLERVGLEPSGRIPGVTGLTGRLEGSTEQGRLEIESRDMQAVMPWLFRDPLAFADLDVDVAWTRRTDGLVVEAPSFTASNPDLALEGRVRLAFPADESPAQMEIYARALDVDVSAAPRYLPVGIMKAGVVAWLDRAVVAGRVPEARLELRGPAVGFPYRQDQGLFRVSFPIEELVLDYAGGWPRAESAKADVLFENEGFWADVSSARLKGLSAGPVAVAIPDLKAGRLSIEGTASGPASSGREWALASDFLRELLAPGLEPAEITRGRLRANVDLLLPLGDLASNEVRVDLELRSVDARFDFLGAPVEDINGRIRIDGASVTQEGLTASLAGRPVELDLGPTESGRTRLRVGGLAGVDTLDTLFGLGFGRHAAGDLRFDGYLEFPSRQAPGPFNLAFRSDLSGVGIGMPVPLGKAPGDVLPVELTVEFPEAGVQDWRIEVAPGLVAAFRLAAGPEGMRLGRPGRPPPGMPSGQSPGVLVGGRLDRLSLGDWFDFAAAGGRDEGAEFAAAFAGAAVSIGELETPIGNYRDVRIESERGEAAWSVRLDGEGLRGAVRIPGALYGGDRIEADMESLQVFAPRPASEENSAADEPGPDEPGTTGEDGPAPVVAPAAIPPMFVSVDDFGLGGLRMGSALLEVVALPGGFELRRFAGGGETFSFKAQGRAVQSDAEDTSRLQLELSSTDIAATLQSVGYSSAMTGDSGRFSLDLTWRGGLGPGIVSAMEGTASLDLRDGRLAVLDTGAGRIFGLLSLQALPRRLTLDFRDVFQEGLVYDEIKGDFEISGGDAYTSNLVLRGPTVDMGVVGRVGLADRDYDQMAVISADLGATVPVAGAVVGGPILGAALWVLSEALRNPLRTQLTYRITGPWNEPVVERVAKGTQAPAPRDQASQAPESEPVAPESPPEATESPPEAPEDSRP